MSKLIPLSQYRLEAVPYGARRSVSSRQFGKIDMVSDGKVDAALLAPNAAPEKFLGISDVAGIIEKQHVMAQRSLSQARHAFESGIRVD